MKNKIGSMTWDACKKCKNQAGPKGCDAGSCLEDTLDLDQLNAGETDEVLCCYFVDKNDGQ